MLRPHRRCGGPSPLPSHSLPRGSLHDWAKCVALHRGLTLTLRPGGVGGHHLCNCSAPPPTSTCTQCNGTPLPVLACVQCNGTPLPTLTCIQCNDTPPLACTQCNDTPPLTCIQCNGTPEPQAKEEKPIRDQPGPQPPARRSHGQCPRPQSLLLQRKQWGAKFTLHVCPCPGYGTQRVKIILRPQ